MDFVCTMLMYKKKKNVNPDIEEVNTQLKENTWMRKKNPSTISVGPVKYFLHPILLNICGDGLKQNKF